MPRYRAGSQGWNCGLKTAGQSPTVSSVNHEILYADGSADLFLKPVEIDRYQDLQIPENSCETMLRAIRYSCFPVNKGAIAKAVKCQYHRQEAASPQAPAVFTMACGAARRQRPRIFHYHRLQLPPHGDREAEPEFHELIALPLIPRLPGQLKVRIVDSSGENSAFRQPGNPACTDLSFPVRSILPGDVLSPLFYLLAIPLVKEKICPLQVIRRARTDGVCGCHSCRCTHSHRFGQSASAV